MKYNKKIVENICASLSKMSSKSAAAKASGITLETYFRWYHTKPEFRKKIDETLTELEDRCKYIALQSVFKGIDTDPRVAMWYLERKHPDEFGRKDRMDMDVNEKKIIFQIGESTNDDMVKLIDLKDKKMIE